MRLFTVIKNSYIQSILFQLQTAKTKAVGKYILTVLFLSASDTNIAVIHYDQTDSDKLVVGEAYFVKNVSFKKDNIYQASRDSSFTLSKRGLENTKR